MNKSLFVAIVTAVVSSLLTIVVNCARNSECKLSLEHIKSEVQNNRESLLVSSIVTAIVVYAILEWGPSFESGPTIPAGLANFANM